MSLSSLALDAFYEVARCRSFSEAAKRIHITQSALSQRILNLEESMELSLFVRSSRGVELTDSGARLLRYCQAKAAFEEELLGDLKSNNPKEISGLVRIAGFSTYVRSILLDQLVPLRRSHPNVRFEILIREARDLEELIKSGQVDFVLTPEKTERQEFVCEQIFVEENILIESSKFNTREDVFLDHDEWDTTTERFLAIQKKKPKKYHRMYFDEIYTIIDGVARGFGRAVVPRHLVLNRNDVKTISGMVPLAVPVYLVYFNQIYTSKLSKEVVKTLSA